MYYFNSNLIARLPYLLGKKKTEVYSLLGARTETFDKWTKGDMTAENLARISNILRISLADFLVVTDRPEEFDRKTDYVFPPDLWKPVEWHAENIATVFGPESLTGVSKTEAAEKLGLSSYQKFDYWAASPSAIRLPDLLKMMNAYQLDATLFFRDGNKPIRLPVWKEPGKHLADIVNARMENNRQLERNLLDMNRTIRSLAADKERLEKENRFLKANAGAGRSDSPFPAILREDPVSYRSAKLSNGYVFHEKLWEALPGMFEMQKQEFCEQVGIGKSSFTSSPNVKVEVLVKACNLFHVSVTHFFPPKSELGVVHDRSYYEIPSRMFVPIENRMNNMKFLFGRYSVLDISSEDLARQCGINPRGFASMAEGGNRSRVITLADVCTQFSIPPALFFKDENRKKPPFAESRNEQLLLNAMEMMREIAELREDNRKLRERLKNETQE